MNEVSINSAEVPWEPATDHPEGTLRKILHRDAEGNPLTVLLKLPPGFVMEDHSHVCCEHHYVMEGEYESMGTRYTAGHYRMIPEHAEHGPFLSATGATVLVIWEP